MCCGTDAGDEAREYQEAKEEAIQDGIAAVNALFGTTARDTEYADQRQNIVDLNTTELNKSYDDAQLDLAFGLARNSLDNSSISVDKKAKQLAEYNENILRVGEIADKSKNDLKTSDERTRQTLINSVQAGLDQTAAVDNAQTNMQLNIDRAEETNVSENWDNMFTQWKRTNRNNRYNDYMNSDDENSFGNTYYTSNKE